MVQDTENDLTTNKIKDRLSLNFLIGITPGAIIGTIAIIIYLIVHFIFKLV